MDFGPEVCGFGNECGLRIFPGERRFGIAEISRVLRLVEEQVVDRRVGARLPCRFDASTADQCAVRVFLAGPDIVDEAADIAINIDPAHGERVCHDRNIDHDLARTADVPMRGALDAALQMHPEILEIGLCRLVVHRAAERGRSEQRALWAAQDHDVVHVERVDVRRCDGIGRIGKRHVIDEVAGGALPLVDAGCGGDTAEHHGRVAGRLRIENDARRAGQVVGHILRAERFKLCARHRRHGAGNFANRFRPLFSSHDDFFDSAGAFGGGGVRGLGKGRAGAQRGGCRPGHESNAQNSQSEQRHIASPTCYSDFSNMTYISKVTIIF